MSDSFYDAPRRGNRDWPDMRLADGVAPLNRIYQDTVTVSADLVRRFVKEERAVREVVVCPASVEGTDVRMVLEGGFELLLDGTGEVTTVAAKTRVVDVSGCETAGEVAGEIARAVAGWLPVFVGAAVGDAVGIYTSTGASAVVRVTGVVEGDGVVLGWERRAVEVGILRPGLPPECLVGSYHPQCGYLMLVGVKLTSATDTHATFSRTWQVDLELLGEMEAVDVEAMLRMGATKAQTLEKTQPPPRQFLPWVRTITETRKARVKETAEVREELMGATVNEENLAASTKTETRQEWGEPVVLKSLAMDLDTGDMRETRQEVVAAGTVALEMGADGRYETVQQVDDLWAIKTTVNAAGLAGRAELGVARRTYWYRDNYSWPRVLDYLDIQPVLSDPGDAYSSVTQYAWRPVWLSEGYDGPCDYEVVERWTLKKPEPRGNPSWNTESPEDEFPDLPTETPMIRRDILFQGADLNVSLPPCLHSGMWIRDSQFFQSYPASIPVRWPMTILARVSLTPDSGGWLTRLYLVHAPEAEGRGVGLELRQEAEGDRVGEVPGRTLTLKWTAGTGGTWLQVSESPTFAGGFLQGYENKEVANLSEVVVTGAKRGMIYYARVKRGELTSNTCVCAMRPVPELGLLATGQPLLSGETYGVGQVTVGESGSQMLTLRNVGLKTLSDIRLVMEGADAAMMTMGTVPSFMLPNSGADVLLEFTPTGTGEKTAVLKIYSNEGEVPYELTLTGMGAAGQMQVEQPAGSVLEVAAVVDFGTVTGESASRVFNSTLVSHREVRENSPGVSVSDGQNRSSFFVFDDVAGVAQAHPPAWWPLQADNDVAAR